MLAKITAVRAVIAIALFLQRVYLADDVPYTTFLAERYRFIYFPFRDRCICTGHGNHIITQHFMSDCQQKRGIHATGETDGQGAQFTDVLFKLCKFLLQFIC